MSIKNPFAPLTKDEIKKRGEAIENMERQIKATAEIGKKCLAHSDFQKYREEAEKARNMIIGVMKERVFSDPMEDAFFLRACINKISVLDMFLDIVNRDAKKEIAK